MLTPARTAPPAAPDAPAVQRDPRYRRWVLLFGLLATLAAVLFPFAPVVQPEVDYRWSAADGAAALPLMPYQPVALTATVDCAVVRDGALLLSTVPPRPDPAAEPLSGLRLIAAAGAIDVTSGGVELGRIPLAPGACTVTVTSDPRATTVSVDDRVVVTKDGDVRPAVVGAFSDVDTGVTLALTADTRFQTTITPLKAVVAVVGVLALLGLLVALHRSDATPARGSPARLAAPPGRPGRHRDARRLVGDRRGHRRRRLHRGHRPQPRRERLHRQRLPLAQRPRVTVQLVLRRAVPVVAGLGGHAVDAPARHAARRS